MVTLTAGAHFFCNRCALVQDYVQLRAELRTKRHDELFAHGRVGHTAGAAQS